jgi:hypothetical protein
VAVHCSGCAEETEVVVVDLDDEALHLKAAALAL